MAKINVVRIDTDPGVKSVKSLREELKQLKNELLNLEEGTEEYSNKLREAGNVQHELAEISEQVRGSAMDLGDQLGNAAKASAGIVGGFQAAAAVMSLFGTESEDVTKAIQKMQTVMAITQGLTAIDSGIKAFKKLGNAVKATSVFVKLFGTTTAAANTSTQSLSAGVGTLAGGMAADATATNAASAATSAFKSALISTGIGALIVGLGVAINAVVENWDKIKEFFGGSVDEIGKNKEALDDLIKSYEDYYDRINGFNTHQINMLKARGSDEKEIAAAELAAAQQLYDEKTKFYEEEREKLESITDLRSSYIRMGYDEDKVLEVTYEKFKSVYGSEAAGDIENIIDVIGDYSKKIRELGEEAKKAGWAVEEMTAANESKRIKEEAEQQKKAYEEAYKNQLNMYSAQIKLSEARYGADWKYVEDGKKLYLQYFDYQLSHEKAGSAEYKNILAQKIAFEKDYQSKREKVIRDAEERLSAGNGGVQENQRIKDLTAQMNDELKIVGLTEEQKATIIKSYEYAISVERGKMVEDGLKRELDIVKKYQEVQFSERKILVANANKDNLQMENDLLESFSKREISYEEYVSKLNQLDKKRYETSLDNIKKEYDINREALSQQADLVETALKSEGLDEETKQRLLDEKIALNQSLLQLDADYMMAKEELRQQDLERENAMNQAIIDAQIETIDLITTTLQDTLTSIAGTADTQLAHISGGLSTIIGGFGQMAKDLAAGQKGWETYAKVASTALTGVGQVLVALGNAQDDSTKEGFEKQKKYQIGAATVNMLAGIVGAWASSMQLPYPANVIVGALMSALMLGTGIAQIAMIKNTKFEGGGSTAGANSYTSVSGGALSDLNPGVQYTQDVQGAEYMNSMADTRVYVVESDIASTASKVSVQENENSY